MVDKHKKNLNQFLSFRPNEKNPRRISPFFDETFFYLASSAYITSRTQTKGFFLQKVRSVKIKDVTTVCFTDLGKLNLLMVGGSILSSSQFLLLPQLPQKMELASKVVKVDSKIIVSVPEI